MSAQWQQEPSPLKSYPPSLKKATDSGISQWWNQAVEQAEKIGRIPLLAFRAHHQQWRIIIPLETITRFARGPGSDSTQEPLDTTMTAWLDTEAFLSLVSESARFER